MKLKSLLAIVGVATATVACAVDSTTTLCRIKVSTTTKSTIVALPLKTVGGVSRTIEPTKVVMPDGLPQNTKLLYWDGASYQSWKNSGTDGAWVKEDSTSATSLTALDCGKGAWLELAEAPSNSQVFYLYGQVLSETEMQEVSSQAVAGTLAAPAYTLLCRPAPAELKISDIKSDDTIATGSIVVVGADSNLPVEYRWDGTSWTKKSVTTKLYGSISVPTVDWISVTDNDKIEAGKGFWFVNVGSAVTLKW